MFVERLVAATVPKLELQIVLPYLGSISSITKARLTRLNRGLDLCKLRFIFETRKKLKNYFRFKDSVLETLQSNFVYKFKCRSCLAFYYGKTHRHMKVRISKRQSVSPRTGKQVKGTLSI